jgi:hypothetical protein
MHTHSYIKSVNREGPYFFFGSSFFMGPCGAPSNKYIPGAAAPPDAKPLAGYPSGPL